MKNEKLHIGSVISLQTISVPTAVGILIVLITLHIPGAAQKTSTITAGVTSLFVVSSWVLWLISYRSNLHVYGYQPLRHALSFSLFLPTLIFAGFLAAAASIGATLIAAATPSNVEIAGDILVTSATAGIALFILNWVIWIVVKHTDENVIAPVAIAEKWFGKFCAAIVRGHQLGIAKHWYVPFFVCTGAYIAPWLFMKIFNLHTTAETADFIRNSLIFSAALGVTSGIQLLQLTAHIHSGNEAMRFLRSDSPSPATLRLCPKN